MVTYPNMGLILSSVPCSRLGKDTNLGGTLRTDIFTDPEAELPFISAIV